MAHALVLAVNQTTAALEAETGISLRARLPVAGRPVLWRVLDAFRHASEIEDVVVVGPAGLPEEMDLPESVDWVEEGETLPESIRRGMRGLGLSTPVVVAPADLALVTAEAIDGLAAAYPRGVDIGYPLVRANEFEEAFPTLPHTALTFREGSFVGTRLVLAKPQAVMMNYGVLQRGWKRMRSVEAAIGILGTWSSLLYSFRLMTARRLAARATRMLMAPCAPLTDLPPEFAFTLDTPEHYRLAQERTGVPALEI